MKDIDEVKKRVQELTTILNQANHDYHTSDKPMISDYLYDQYLNELVNLEEMYPDLKAPDSPTNKIGGAVLEGFNKVVHNTPMMSLSNKFSISELEKFCQDIIKEYPNSEFVFEEKIDGLAIDLYYESGLLKQAATRGDGQTGEDVTSNIKTIKSIPLSINLQQPIHIRGEVFMTTDEFERINEERLKDGLELFANPRNATAGSIRQLDSKVVQKRNLACFLYAVVEAEKYGLLTQVDTLNFLISNKFLVNKNYQLVSNLSNIESVINEFSRKVTTNNYGVDGVVCKVNSHKTFASLGVTSKFPKGATAYKFPPKMVKTKLLDITYQVGRQGVITPVAELEPVKLDGTTIRRATLHNFLYIKDKDIRIGDNVYIYKAGEIIPKVDRVEIKDRLTDLPKISKITTCPTCGAMLDTTDSGIIIFCPNKNCPDKAVNKLVYFASRGAMNIEGLAEKYIRLLYERGYLTNIQSIYHLANYRESITAVNNDLKVKSQRFDNFISSIEQSKTRPFKYLLSALGIKNVGLKTAELLVSHFITIDNLMHASFEELTSILEIGPEIANEVINFFKDEKNLELINFFKNNGFVLTYKETSKKALSGYNIVVTGTLLQFKRHEIMEHIEANGGTFSTSISKQTTHLLVGDKPSDSKVDKARQNNIKIITEEEYIKISNEK